MRQPHADHPLHPSAADDASGASDPRDPRAPAVSEPSPRVVVWEWRRDRLALLERAISECGARAYHVEELPAVQMLDCSAHCALALVALRSIPADLGLEVTRVLKTKGFEVVCYEDAARSRPVGVQCRPLLAGAGRLLDSAADEFRTEARHCISEGLRVVRERQSKEEQIKVVMRSLGIVGESRAMTTFFQWILRIAPLSDVPVLITGETGTGKELVARAIYQLDLKRRDGPFVAVNCGAISPGLAESELFGHRHGAFTGANRDRAGLIRSASGGVLFLDEIGDLDLPLQGKLLRVLQENRILAVGEDREVSIDMRVIAATNRNLDDLMREGRFRPDLFHRISLLAGHLPPLRERPEDLKRWNERLLELETLRDQAARAGRGRRPLTETELARAQELGRNLEAGWHAPTTMVRDRKRLLRALIDEVQVRTEEQCHRVRIVWKGGAVTEREVARFRIGDGRPRPLHHLDPDLRLLRRQLSSAPARACF